MKRMMVMLAAVALMTAALAVPAFAVASENANCVGQSTSLNNYVFNDLGAPGLGGRLTAFTAQGTGLGSTARNC